MNNDHITKTWLITETVRVAYKVEAKTREEAEQAYFDAFSNTFANKGGILDCEESFEMKTYLADSNEEFHEVKE